MRTGGECADVALRRDLRQTAKRGYEVDQIPDSTKSHRVIWVDRHMVKVCKTDNVGVTIRNADVYASGHVAKSMAIAHDLEHGLKRKLLLDECQLYQRCAVVTLGDCAPRNAPTDMTVYLPHTIDAKISTCSEDYREFTCHVAQPSRSCRLKYYPFIGHSDP